MTMLRTPRVELPPDCWRQGLALEAAVAMAGFGLEPLVGPELGMRYRGLEPWYGTVFAVHALSRADWLHREIPA